MPEDTVARNGVRGPGYGLARVLRRDRVFFAAISGGNAEPVNF
jgi:hypothetical protein